MRKILVVAAFIVCLSASDAGAQSIVSAGEFHRVFVAASGGAQGSSNTFQDNRSDPLFGEDISWTANYKTELARGFDVSAGLRIWRNLVASVAVSRVAEKQPASVAGQVPHPFFFERVRAINVESRLLAHSEQAVHVSATWLIPVSPRVQLSLAAGPSFFTVDRDFIQDVAYTETYPYDEAIYQDVVVREVSGSETGFHVGGDLSWFFLENVGIGVAGRVARAQAHLTSPVHQQTVAVDLGGTQAAVGVRLRFGGR